MPAEPMINLTRRCRAVAPCTPWFTIEAAARGGSQALPLLVLALLDQARRQLQVVPDARALALARHVQTQALRREGHSREAMQQLEQLHALAASRPTVDAFLTVTALGVVASVTRQRHRARGVRQHGRQRLVGLGPGRRGR
jgi:hypothetical protein